MFREALSAPRRTDDAATTLFMGGLLVGVTAITPFVMLFVVRSVLVALLLLPFVLFPPLVLRGYYVRTVRAGLHEERATPSFVRWGELVRDGVKSTLLSLGYLLPLGLCLGITGASTFLLAGNVVAPGSPASVAAALGIVLGCLGTGGYGLVYLYVRPAALSVFAAEGRLRDGFALRRVLGVARAGHYAGGWFRAMVVLAVGLTIALPTTLAVVGVFVAFYARVVEHLLYGQGAAVTLDVDDDDPVRIEPVDERPPEAPASVQTGRTVGVVAGRDSRGGESPVELDGGGDETRRQPATDSSQTDDPFVWERNRTRDE